MATLRTALFGTALALLGCNPAAPEDDDGLDGVDIDLREALAIGEEHEPDGVAVEAELDLEGEPFYEVEMFVEAAAEVREVVIEPDGTVSDVVIDPEDLPKAIVVVEALASSVVTLDEAIVLAEEAGDGFAIAVTVDGNVAIEVVVLNDEETLVLAVSQRDASITAIGEDPDD